MVILSTSARRIYKKTYRGDRDPLIAGDWKSLVVLL
jgi:hypothetical protein